MRARRRWARAGSTLAALKQAADSGGDLAALAPRIEWLIALVGRTADPVPRGQRRAGSDAGREIWSDRAGFDARRQRFQAAARALAAPAAAGDRAAFLTAWTEVRASCGGCHDGFQERLTPGSEPELAPVREHRLGGIVAGRAGDAAAGMGAGAAQIEARQAACGNRHGRASAGSRRAGRGPSCRGRCRRRSGRSGAPDRAATARAGRPPRP